MQTNHTSAVSLHTKAYIMTHTHITNNSNQCGQVTDMQTHYTLTHQLCLCLFWAKPMLNCDQIVKSHWTKCWLHIRSVVWKTQLLLYCLTNCAHLSLTNSSFGKVHNVTLSSNEKEHPRIMHFAMVTCVHFIIAIR
jgi:hypothetical protein